MEARVKITAPHGHAQGTEVLVDGVKVERLSGLDVSIAVGEHNTVRLHLVARAQDIEIAAQVRIGGTVLPEAVERALLAYLQAKYPKHEGEPQFVEVTTIDQAARQFAQA